MYVVKRDGSKEKLDISNIRKQTQPACEGLVGTSFESLELDCQINFQDGIKTEDIQQVLIQTALNKIDVDKPNWTYVAQRLSLYDLYHKIKHFYNKRESGDVYELVTLDMYIERNKNIFSNWTSKYSDSEISYLNSLIKQENDLLFDYPGFSLMKDMYLAKNDGKHSELPQHMHMGIAMFAMQDEKKEKRIKYVEETYKMLSNLEYINATPINANGRLNQGGLISCLLTTVEDSTESIMEKARELAFGSRNGAGFGIDFSRIRSIGAKIGNNVNASKGKIPFLKMYNDISIAFDQGGRRPGSFAVYIECWDLEIYDFIDLRKMSGEERRRARDLFFAINYNDLFMEREEQDADWTLFDPNDVPELTETWGDNFRQIYENYERLYNLNKSKFNPNTRVIKARDLIRAQAISWSDIGMPFIAFKDTINNKHKYQHLGPIRSSNLCVHGDTKILTREYGNESIGKLVEEGIETVTCWNGEEWSETKIFKTSDEDEVLTVFLSNNEWLKATLDHEWCIDVDGQPTKIKTKDLQCGMKIYPYELPDPNSGKDEDKDIPMLNSASGETIINIMDVDEMVPTYCGTEPKRHMMVFNGILTYQCTEVVQFTDKDHTGVCNLGSLNLARMTSQDRLREVIKLANRLMDNCIDHTPYPSVESERFQKRFRSVGLGSLGEGEWLANNKIYYGSEEHKKVIDQLWKLISETLYESSHELAEEKGGCEVDPYYRNAYLMAIAPNSSSAIFAGTTNGLEPVYNTIWIEENKRGSYKMVAPHLTLENLEYYKNPYQIDMMKQLEVNAIRAKYIDMAQSQNVFLDPEGLGIKRVRDIINYAWKLGVKTLYYLRSKPPKIGIRANDEGISCVGCAN